MNFVEVSKLKLIFLVKYFISQNNFKLKKVFISNLFKIQFLNNNLNLIEKHTCKLVPYSRLLYGWYLVGYQVDTVDL